MSNFWQRTITGTLFVIVLVGAVLWNEYSFSVLLFVICVLGLREYAVLFNGKAHKPNYLGTILAGSGIALCWGFANIIDYDKTRYLFGFFNDYSEGIFFGSLSFPIIAELILTKKPSLINIGLSYAGIFYINLGLFCFSFFGHKFWQDCFNPTHYFPLHIIGFLILLWSSDTFAYLSGRAFGRTQLAPKISPKKTWEGLIGGAICTIGVSLLLFKIIGYFDVYQWMGLAFIIVVFGTIGDLIESKFKRTLDVKDSGNILPGHGGILDRFDSLLLAAPAALFFWNLYSFYFQIGYSWF